MIEVFENGEGLTRKNFSTYYTYILLFNYDYNKGREYQINNHIFGGSVFTTHCIGEGSWWCEQGRTVRELIHRIRTKYNHVSNLKIIQVRDTETYNKWKLAQKLKA